jgi:N-acetylneuraminate lyase
MKLQGAIPALVTPYDSSGQVCEDMLRRLVDTHIRAGVNGLYVCGSSGEGPLLKTAERKKAVEVVVSQTKGRIPVIAHVGSLSTDDAVELATHAGKSGADGVASIPPFYYPVSLDGIHAHYSRIAKSSSLPLIVYNIPALTGVTVSPAMFSKLTGIPGVAGIKFSSNNLFELRQIASNGQGKLQVMSGNDEIFLAALTMGAEGSIGLTHNFMPKLYLDIFAKYKSGHLKEAQDLQTYAVQVIAVLIKYPVIPASKEIMRLKGYDCGSCRGPLEVLTDQQRRDLRADLEKLGFLDKDLGL